MLKIVPSILLVAAGSALGGVLRYLVSLMSPSCLSGSFPTSTLLVNLLGCLLVGMLWGLLSRLGLAESGWSLLLLTGVAGGFTTFSTFARESLMMLEAGSIGWLLLYVVTSVVLGIALVALGYYLVH